MAKETQKQTDTMVVRVTRTARELMEKAHIQVITKTNGEVLLRRDTLEYVLADFVKRNSKKNS